MEALCKLNSVSSRFRRCRKMICASTVDSFRLPGLGRDRSRSRKVANSVGITTLPDSEFYMDLDDNDSDYMMPENYKLP